MEIKEILEYKKVWNYILNHNLLWQYKKAKEKLLEWDTKSVGFKKRKPYKTEKYQFRINKKYRAFCFFEDNILKVFEISDHQY
jgi:glutamate synthase domain-containing protein 3